MRRFKIKYTRYIIPPEYKSTPEYREAMRRIKLWKQQGDRFVALDLSNLNLEWLPSLPNTLYILVCRNNELTSLPHLPNNLKTLICYSNHLSSLPHLPNSLRILNCMWNKLTELHTLPNMLLKYCS